MTVWSAPTTIVDATGAAMAPMMAETPMYKSYQAVAPKVDDFPRLLDAMGDFMRQPYDWSADVAKLKMPVMLVFGDADMIRPEFGGIASPENDPESLRPLLMGSRAR